MDNTSFAILPYEEYVRDIEVGRRSTFEKIDPFADKFFGVLLGILIALLFWVVKREDLLSVQSLAAILGAYALGKEMWLDLDNFLVNTSKKWDFRWREAQYFYAKEDFGTIQRFWRLARTRRNGQPFILPEFLDFMTHSNSKTVELSFDKASLSRYKTGTEIQFGSVVFKPESEPDLKAEGAMFGFKFSLRQRFWIGDLTYEVFQAVEKNQTGTVDSQGNWHFDSVVYRKVWNFGRFRFYLSKDLIKDFKLISNH